jgi:AcrR family transcriptional regulator
MKIPDNATRQRVLDVAEGLFATRGYAAVSLREIGQAVGMEHASLYYYAPGGKEQLYVEVMERNLKRHRDGLSRALSQREGLLGEKLRAAAEWLLSQPPLDLTRMVHADMAHFKDKSHEQRLMLLAYNALRRPLIRAFREAEADGQVTMADPSLAALAFVTLVESVHGLPSTVAATHEGRLSVIDQIIVMLMDGWRPRTG